MGCDIHLLIETKDVDGNWKMHGKMEDDDGFISPAETYSGRNYTLFGVLAGVRSESVTAIAAPRGVPDDASEEYKAFVEQWDGDGHSHSYHTLAQLLDYDWTMPKVTRGWVALHAYDQWRGYWEKVGDGPSFYCGGVGGGNTVHLTREEADAILGNAPTDYAEKEKWLKTVHAHAYVNCEWTQPTARNAGEEVWYGLIAPMLNLSKLHGGHESVRIVFFFDN